MSRAGRLLGRRLQLLLVLAAIATTVGAVNASGASFVSQSSTTVTASAAAIGTYSMAAEPPFVGGQVAIAGTAVANNPEVRITDQRGNPVSGLQVTFTVLTPNGQVASPTAVTDTDGLASAGAWTLSTTPGSNSLRVSCAGVPNSPLTFSATGTVGPAKRIELWSGDNQSATVGQAVGAAPCVRVTDAGGNPVSNFSVTFTVGSGGGSVNGGNNAKTNAQGIASPGSWTLGTTVGTNTLIATASLAGSPVTFTATATAGAASRIAIDPTWPVGQTVHVGTAVSAPPRALVTDAYGNPVAGVSVQFAVASGGGSVTGSPATTNAAGIATLGSWTLGLNAGQNSVTATRSGLTGSPVTFFATGISGSPTTMAMVPGTSGLSATVNAAVSTPPKVLVTDALGSPVPNVSVIFAVTANNGSVTTTNATTDASGVASAGSWRLGTTAGVNTVTATSPGLSGSPVTFSATGLAGAATKYLVTSDNYSPRVTSTVLVTAQLADQYDNPVRTAGLAVAFSKSPPGSGSLSNAAPATDSNGAATVNLTVGNTVGTAYTVTATSGNGSSQRSGTTPAITTIAGTPTQLAVSAGNGQTATVNTAVATAPSVIVRDVYGNPVSGVVVTFTAAADSGSVTGASATTNASGVATVGSWILGTTAGANTLTATFAGYTGTPATFTATGVAGPATRYVVTASDYNPLAGSPITMTAQLADQYGNPVATGNLRVRWTKTGKGGWFTATRTYTNASGVATTTFYVSGTVGRVHTVTATSTNPSTRRGTSAAITTH